MGCSIELRLFYINAMRVIQDFGIAVESSSIELFYERSIPPLAKSSKAPTEQPAGLGVPVLFGIHPFDART